MFLFIHVDWQVCWKCEATKGSADLDACYTNLRDDASWRASMWQNLPWSQTPEFANCRGFHVYMLAADILHLFHLGTGRDLVGSSLKVLVKTINTIMNALTIESSFVCC